VISPALICCSNLSSDGLSGAIGELSLSSWSVCFLISLVWAVDGDFDSDLTALDLLSVHFRDSLLLLLFGRESNETEATALTGFVTGLELLNHEARNWAKGDLGGGWFIASEEFLEL
jgi:hypothetical protein